jgi:hypothetical protein
LLCVQQYAEYFWAQFPHWYPFDLIAAHCPYEQASGDGFSAPPKTETEPTIAIAENKEAKITFLIILMN